MLLLTLLQGCAPYGVQSPTVDLREVHESGAHRIAFDPAGERLASGGLRGRVHVWRTVDGGLLKSFADHSSRVTGLAWVGSDALLSADSAGHLQVREVDSGAVLAQQRVESVANLSVVSDAAWVAVIGDKSVNTFALPDLRALQNLPLASQPLAIAVDRSASQIALSTRDGRVQLLNKELTPLAELRRPTRDVHTLAFSPDGRTLLGGAWFKLLVWDLDAGTLEERSTEHLGKINSVDISPDGMQWISLGRQTDSRFQLIDANTNAVLRRFKPHELCGRQARFSPDGRYVASSADDGSIHVYDLQQPHKTYVPYLNTE